MIDNLSGILPQPLLSQRVVAEEQVAMLGLSHDKWSPELRVTSVQPFPVLLLGNKYSVSLPFTIHIKRGRLFSLSLKRSFPKWNAFCSIIAVSYQIRQELSVDISRIKGVRSRLGQHTRIRNVETYQTGIRNISAQGGCLYIVGDKTVTEILLRSTPLI